jgi:hypothetical protein
MSSWSGSSASPASISPHRPSTCPCHAFSHPIASASCCSSSSRDELARSILLAGISFETDTALALPGASGNPPGVAAETDAAFALGLLSIRAVGLATETDYALSVAVESAMQASAPPTGRRAQTSARPPQLSRTR